MDGLDELDDDSGDTVFRDVILLALSGFVAIVILLLPHLNPPVEAHEAPPPGNVVVEIRWPDTINADVDLWVEAPGDRPVGYSNKGGRVFNLLRDDLGKYHDLTDVNYEFAFSRGIPNGEYVINVHLYRNSSSVYPVPVTVVASIKKSTSQSLKRLVTSKVELTHRGEEITVFRFRLDDRGKLVPGSIHNLQKGLRSARKAG